MRASVALWVSGWQVEVPSIDYELLFVDTLRDSASFRKLTSLIELNNFICLQISW